MTASAPPAGGVPSQARVLRRLFLTLFLRGRSARQLRTRKLPKSVAGILGTSLLVYTLIGSTAGMMASAPIFGLALYLHAMTFVLVGVFVAASAGEVLFSAEEADILMHRPVDPGAMLRAKIGVLLQVSLWLALAFNVVGFAVGVFGDHGGWRFVPVHAVSMAIATLFCAGSIVLTYQLCLRWFGRERLDGLMTTTQVAVSVLLVLGSQLLPQVMDRGGGGGAALARLPWWVRLLPPAWFAGIDDALAGTARPDSWLLAAIGVAATALVLWLAFARLAGDYGEGLRRLNDRPAAVSRSGRRRWFDRALAARPIAWWLRDPASRAAFVLTTAYLLRDRDMKLRIYPAIAPMLVWPFLLLLRSGHGGVLDLFGVAFAGVYLGLVPLMGLTMIRYSQNWQAADLFHVVPIDGPGALAHGARRAVLLLLALPVLVVFAAVALVVQRDLHRLVFLLPGLLALPIYAILPCLGGRAIPCSVPPDGAASTRRTPAMFAVMAVASVWGLIVALAAPKPAVFAGLLVFEAAAVTVAYALMRRAVTRAPWPAEAAIG